MPKKKTTLPNTAGRRAAQRKYNSKPSSIADRSSRNKARRAAMKAGIARKGDGKDIHHKDGNPRNNSRGNLRAVSPSVNRNKNYRG